MYIVVMGFRMMYRRGAFNSFLLSAFLRRVHAKLAIGVWNIFARCLLKAVVSEVICNSTQRFDANLVGLHGHVLPIPPDSSPSLVTRKAPNHTLSLSNQIPKNSSRIPVADTTVDKIREIESYRYMERFRRGTAWWLEGKHEGEVLWRVY